MLKWILAAAGAALLASFVLWQRDLMKTTYVNGLAAYADLPGREFIFERDCYIFKFKDHDTDWPLVADHDAVAELPAKVTEAEVGADLPGVRLLDVVRTGARFQIVSVRRDESSHGTKITFDILFLDEAARKFPRLDAYWIMDHSPEATGAAPRLWEQYAVPQPKY